MNLLYWQVTCEAFCTPEEWKWWLKMQGTQEIIHLYILNNAQKNKNQSSSARRN